jgi:hypothetical protein
LALGRDVARVRPSQGRDEFLPELSHSSIDGARSRRFSACDIDSGS